MHLNMQFLFVFAFVLETIKWYLMQPEESPFILLASGHLQSSFNSSCAKCKMQTDQSPKYSGERAAGTIQC